MLAQLEFKLNVEKQYKEGIDKMMKLYQMEGDRKSRQDAEARGIESNQKIQLLKQALKRYTDVNIAVAGEDENDGNAIRSVIMEFWLTNHR
jgi:classical protein kinase C